MSCIFENNENVIKIIYLLTRQKETLEIDNRLIFFKIMIFIDQNSNQNILVPLVSDLVIEFSNRLLNWSLNRMLNEFLIDVDINVKNFIKSLVVNVSEP